MAEEVPDVAVPDEAAGEVAAEAVGVVTTLGEATPGAQDTPPIRQMACVTAIIPMGIRLGTVWSRPLAHG